jgi:hypothetical protein
MKILLDDYQRKLKSINELIDKNTNNGGMHDMLRKERLLTTSATYRAIIVEIEQAIEREECCSFKEKCVGGFVMSHNTNSNYKLSKNVRKYSPTPIVRIKKDDKGNETEEIVLVSIQKKDSGNALSNQIIRLINRDIKNEIIDIRNNLYDILPTGQVDAFELSVAISNHLKKFDKYIDTL